MITVQLYGLEIFGRHGATDEERERGQTFLYDVELDVSDAALSDRLDDAVDYEEVAACIRGLSAARQFTLLEALAAAAADEIVARFPVGRVRVRVRKPEVRPAGMDVEWSAASVERTT
jgi:7,8-dihydroneopterin aldolase/epimerase/oxygenase